MGSTMENLLLQSDDDSSDSDNEAESSTPVVATAAGVAVAPVPAPAPAPVPAPVPAVVAASVNPAPAATSAPAPPPPSAPYTNAAPAAAPAAAPSVYTYSAPTRQMPLPSVPAATAATKPGRSTSATATSSPSSLSPAAAAAALKQQNTAKLKSLYNSSKNMARAAASTAAASTAAMNANVSRNVNANVNVSRSTAISSGGISGSGSVQHQASPSASTSRSMGRVQPYGSAPNTSNVNANSNANVSAHSNANSTINASTVRHSQQHGAFEPRNLQSQSQQNIGMGMGVGVGMPSPSTNKQLQVQAQPSQPSPHSHTQPQMTQMSQLQHNMHPKRRNALPMSSTVKPESQQQQQPVVAQHYRHGHGGHSSSTTPSQHHTSQHRSSQHHTSQHQHQQHNQPQQNSQHGQHSQQQHTQRQHLAQQALSQQDQKSRKESFLMFTKVLMKYLEAKDAAMHSKAKTVIRECAKKNKENVRGFESLSASMQNHLLHTVGKHYWSKAEDYLAQYLGDQYKKKGLSTSEAHRKARLVAKAAAAPLTATLHTKLASGGVSVNVNASGSVAGGPGGVAAASTIANKHYSTVQPSSFPNPQQQQQQQQQQPSSSSQQGSSGLIGSGSMGMNTPTPQQQHHQNQQQLTQHQQKLNIIGKTIKATPQTPSSTATSAQSSSAAISIPSIKSPITTTKKKKKASKAKSTSSGGGSSTKGTSAGSSSSTGKKGKKTAAQRKAETAAAAAAASGAASGGGSSGSGSAALASTTGGKKMTSSGTTTTSSSSSTGPPRLESLKEYAELMEMVDHVVDYDVGLCALIFNDKKTTSASSLSPLSGGGSSGISSAVTGMINISEEQRKLLYGTGDIVRRGGGHSSDDGGRGEHGEHEAGSSLPPHIRGWGDRNVVSARAAWAKLRLAERDEAKELASFQLPGFPGIDPNPNPESSPDPDPNDSKSGSVEQKGDTISDRDKQQTAEQKSQPSRLSWRNEESAEEDEALALISEATQEYMRTILETAVSSARQRLNIDGVRLWHQQLAAAAAKESGQKSVPPQLVSDPPLYLRLGCDVRRQCAMAEGNAAKTCQRMEEALARVRKNGDCNGEGTRVLPSGNLNDRETLYQAASMSELAKLPVLPNASKAASYNAKRSFEIYGGKHSIEPPFGRVPEKVMIGPQDIQACVNSHLGVGAPRQEKRRRTRTLFY